MSKKVVLISIASVFILGVVTTFVYLKLDPSSGCRNWYGKPIINYLQEEIITNGETYYGLYGCFESMQLDGSSNLKIKLAFFDKLWRKKEYILTAGRLDDPSKIQWCYYRSVHEAKCDITSTRALFATYGNKKVKNIEFVMGSDDKNLFYALKQSIRTNSDFPNKDLIEKNIRIWSFRDV